MPSHPSTRARAANNFIALILGALALPGAVVVLYYHPLTGVWIRHRVTQWSASPSTAQAAVPDSPSNTTFESDLDDEAREAASATHQSTKWISAPNDSSSSKKDSLLESETSLQTPPSSDQNATAASSVQPPVLRLETRFGTIDGVPIARFVDETWVLQNSGAIQHIPASEVVTERMLTKEFSPVSASEMAADLRREFGGGFQVRWEQPYLFVSRTKGSAFWGERFRGLQASMKQFCRNAGLSTRQLPFPLVVVILGSQGEFRQYCQTHGINVPENCVGVYSQKTNRIALFEDPNLAEKQNTVDTICHEAAHQLAFNLGLHQRCAATPLWLAEGFATLFEAPRYALPVNHHLSSWPAARRAAWTKLASDPARTRALLESLIKNDNFFEESPDEAYALAWGLTHFLATNHSKSFSQYLRSVGELEPFLDAKFSKRIDMFCQSFGSDTSKLTKALIRHIESLR
ncbi:DUF1570 domain-containing protein [Pirellulaceae bacterium SH501]